MSTAPDDISELAPTPFHVAAYTGDFDLMQNIIQCTLFHLYFTSIVDPLISRHVSPQRASLTPDQLMETLLWLSQHLLLRIIGWLHCSA
jgi:hypothetical protein